MVWDLVERPARESVRIEESIDSQADLNSVSVCRWRERKREARRIDSNKKWRERRLLCRKRGGRLLNVDKLRE